MIVSCIFSPSSGQSSWAGCGQHLDSVFRNIPTDNRCKCGYNEDEWNTLVAKGASDPSFRGPYPKGGSAGCTIA